MVRHHSEDEARDMMMDEIQSNLEIEDEKEISALNWLPTSLLLKLYRHTCTQFCDVDGCRVDLYPDSSCGIHGTDWKDPV